jgi:hypothetical protein
MFGVSLAKTENPIIIKVHKRVTSFDDGLYLYDCFG